MEPSKSEAQVTDSTLGKDDRFIKWDEKATQILIENRLRMNDRFNNAQTGQDTELLWMLIQKCDFLTQGYNFNSSEIILYWDHLLSVYTRIKNDQSQFNEDKTYSGNWQYFEIMYNVLEGIITNAELTDVSRGIQAIDQHTHIVTSQPKTITNRANMSDSIINNAAKKRTEIISKFNIYENGNQSNGFINFCCCFNRKKYSLNSEESDYVGQIKMTTINDDDVYANGIVNNEYYLTRDPLHDQNGSSKNHSMLITNIENNSYDQEGPNCIVHKSAESHESIGNFVENDRNNDKSQNCNKSIKEEHSYVKKEHSKHQENSTVEDIQYDRNVDGSTENNEYSQKVSDLVTHKSNGHDSNSNVKDSVDTINSSETQNEFLKQATKEELHCDQNGNPENDAENYEKCHKASNLVGHINNRNESNCTVEDNVVTNYSSDTQTHPLLEATKEELRSNQNSSFESDVENHENSQKMNNLIEHKSDGNDSNCNVKSNVDTVNSSESQNKYVLGATKDELHCNQNGSSNRDKENHEKCQKVSNLNGHKSDGNGSNCNIDTVNSSETQNKYPLEATNEDYPCNQTSNSESVFPKASNLVGHKSDGNAINYIVQDNLNTNNSSETQNEHALQDNKKDFPRNQNDDSGSYIENHENSQKTSSLVSYKSDGNDSNCNVKSNVDTVNSSESQNKYILGATKEELHCNQNGISEDDRENREKSQKDSNIDGYKNDGNGSKHKDEDKVDIINSSETSNTMEELHYNQNGDSKGDIENHENST